MVSYEVYFAGEHPMWAWVFPLDRYLVYIFVVSIGYLVWRWYRDKAVDFALVILIGTALSVVLKKLIQKPRPLVPGFTTPFHGESFPSTHTTIAFTAAFFYILVCHYLSKMPNRGGDSIFKYLRVGKVSNVIVPAVVLLTALIIGILRVVVKAHYPVDIFAGIILGLSVVSAYIYYDAKVSKKH